MSRFLALCLPLVLAACAPLAPKPEALSSPTGAQAVEQFQLAGRVGVKHEDKGFSGGVRWQHAPDNDALWFITPLGQTVARLNRDATGVTLVDSEQRVYRAPDAETLTQGALGWKLPLGGLQYWITGRASPGSAPKARFDEQGRLAELFQDGWHIQFLRYTADRESLPTRLDLQYGNLEIKLVVDNWVVGAPPASRQP